jgi:hypothetical protein
MARGLWKDPDTSLGRFRIKGYGHIQRPSPHEAGKPKVAFLRDGHCEYGLANIRTTRALQYAEGPPCRFSLNTDLFSM